MNAEPMSERHRKKQETRAQILVAARATFGEVGYAATTMRALAASSGVGLGTIHAHFGDKRGLLAACLHDDIQRSVAKAWKDLDASASLESQLMHCARCLFEGYARHPELSKVMLAETLFPADSSASDALLEPFLARIAELHLQNAKRSLRATTPEEAMTAARAFFAFYMTTLIGGLGGAFGSPRSRGARVRAWCEALQPLVRQHLLALGARG